MHEDIVADYEGPLVVKEWMLEEFVPKDPLHDLGVSGQQNERIKKMLLHSDK